MTTYADSGFNENLTRVVGGVQEFDAVSIDQLLADTAIGDKKIKSLSADKITAGVISVVAFLGDQTIELNGEDRVIIVYDEVPLDRVRLGKIS